MNGCAQGYNNHDSRQVRSMVVLTGYNNHDSCQVRSMVVLTVYNNHDSRQVRSMVVLRDTTITAPVRLGQWLY